MANYRETSHPILSDDNVPRTQYSSDLCICQAPGNGSRVVTPNFIQIFKLLQVKQHCHLIESGQFLSERKGRQRSHIVTDCTQILVKTNGPHPVELCLEDNLLPSPRQ